MVKTPKSRLKVCVGLSQKFRSDSNFGPPPKKLTPPNHWLCHKMLIRAPKIMHYFCFWFQISPQDTPEHHSIHTYACGVLGNTLNAYKERKSVPPMSPRAYFGHSKLPPPQKKKQYGFFITLKMIIFHPMNTC